MTGATAQPLSAPALPRALRTALAGLAVVALAALAGVLSAHAVGSQQPPRIERHGDLRMQVPASWRAAPASSLRASGARLGFEVPGGVQALAVVAPIARVSLMPTPLERLLVHAPGRPEAARVAGWRAWLYQGLQTRDGRTMDIAVIPTSRGMLAIACAVAGTAGTRAGACLDDIEAASLAGAVAFVPEQDLALRLQLPGILAAVDAERVSRRAALAAAPRAGARVDAVGGLAAAYGRAASELRALGATAPLGAQLEITRKAYRDLSQAALARDRSGYRAAAARIDSGESGLTAAVERLASEGALREPATQSAVAVPPRSTTQGPRVVIVLLTALAVLLLACTPPVRGIIATLPEAVRSERPMAPAVEPAPPRRPKAPAAPASGRGPAVMAVAQGVRGLESCSLVLMRAGGTARFFVLPGTQRNLAGAVAQTAAFPVPRLGPIPPDEPVQQAHAAVLGWLARQGFAPAGESSSWDELRLIKRMAPADEVLNAPTGDADAARG
jgi:hypothetical protein